MKAWTKSAVSVRPCRERAASCRPAIQPSVRASSAATSSGRELQAHHLVEEGGGLVRGEAQVGGAQLVSWPRARRRASGSGGSSRVAMTRCSCGGRCSSKKARAWSTGWASIGVVVVQHQDQAVWQGGEVVEQRRQHRLGGRRLRGLERGQRALSHVRRDRLQRRDQIGQKAGGVVVAFVQRQPGGRQAAAGDPLADQRGLAKPGGGGDQGQFTGQSLRSTARAAAGAGQSWAGAGGLYTLVAKMGVGTRPL